MLTLSRLLMLLALPVLVFRAWREGAVAVRFGRGRYRPARVWVHAASVGEVTSARAVIAGLAGPVLVTCNTPTAVAMAAGWGIAEVQVALAPYDLPGVTGRVLRATGARALVIVENELWPGRIAACQAAGVAVAIVGGRMSARSAGRWAWMGAGLRRLMAGLALVSPQDAASGARFRALGAQVGPVLNLKAFVTAGPAPRGPVPRAACLLAASTHEGEEALVLDALPDWADLLILAPRHPQRARAVLAEIAARGLSVGQRSAGAEPGGARVYLADTLGEMDRWYGMAGVTVIGGTFAPRGGHTPFEPAAAGSAILHGPDVANFAEVFAALAAADGAVAVADGAGMRAALAAMTPERQAALASAAGQALAPAGDLTALIAAVNRLAG